MNKGFSLVELIVVIAIMAILVGVAVPVYTSYIDKAEDGVNEQFEDELVRAVNTALIDVNAGLSEDNSKNWTVPTSIEIVNGVVNATVPASGSAAEVDCTGFESVFTGIITVPSNVQVTFEIDDNGVASIETISYEAVQ